MNRICLLIALTISVSQIVFAQNEKSKGSSMTYINAGAKISKYHTEEELKQLGKLELTQLYMERVAVITEVIPYLALHTKPGATLKEMGIPETELNKEHLEKEVKNKATYLTAVKNTLDDIIPYADKSNIIWSILFSEEIIKKAAETQHE
jgi:hypothetical protein